jgi:hypothetical protein
MTITRKYARIRKAKTFDFTACENYFVKTKSRKKQ